MRIDKTFLSAAAAVVFSAGLALAANTTFVTSIGDLVFPFTPPTAAGGAGAIDNMVIGATTPRAGNFTTINTQGNACSTDPCTNQGLNAAQGGAIVQQGGTSSTSADAGGASRVTGGTPGATGVGGAVTVTGGAGGATSGAGGNASVAGGAGTNNANGGTGSVAGGAGQGSGNGGAASVTGGAAGATGVGGAATVAAGAPTAGNGSNVNITASAGAGGTNGGGSVNITAGAAVSTGAPGVVNFNGDAGLQCATYFFTGTPAATNQVFFLATRPLLLQEVSEVHSAAAGGTSTLGVFHDTSTNAPAGGTDVLTADFNLNATANTPQVGVLSATVATVKLAAGDRLSVKFNNAIQSSAGVVVTACGAPI